jgi:hypothetical protein
LDAIGFKQPSLIPILGKGLIDFQRIVPSPDPENVSREWIDKNWGAIPYGGEGEDETNAAAQECILEQGRDRVKFKFYTRWWIAQPVITALAERFPEYKFTLFVWNLSTDMVGGEVYENGEQISFTDLHHLDDPEYLTEVQLKSPDQWADEMVLEVEDTPYSARCSDCGNWIELGEGHDCR